MMTSIIPAHLTGNWSGITPTLSLQRLHRIPVRNPDYQNGNCSTVVVRTGEVGARSPTAHSDQPLGQSSYKSHGFCEESQKYRNSCEQFCKLSDLKCKLSCRESCTFFCLAATKEGHRIHCKSSKICERCFLCRSVVFGPVFITLWLWHYSAASA